MRYGVLGPVEARLDDVVVAVGGPQQRRLLALLLLRPGESISAERLVDCLWPDGLAPEGAGRSVMTYVSRLRAALGDSTISTVHEGYRLDVNGSVIDSRQFESLLAEAGTADPGRAVELYDRALALWRGGAYGEFGGEFWLMAEANRLNELRVVAMEERAEAILALGNYHRIVPELERLTADHPLRERPVGLLMRALFAAGRHADALRVFQSFRTRLGEETGLEPSDELVALERSLASGQPLANITGRARLLRGYVVHEVLGEGAFGRVYAATQPGTNREVAIKAIRPELSDSAEFIQRFEAEAQLVARLEHPHIVPLYDYWREPGAAYLVFRLLLGGTALGAMVGEGPFSVARVSRLVEEVGGALLAAHTAGVVHCDIKPSNVLFDESGNGYLTDFGIAVTSYTHDPSADRTRVYAAPELLDRTGDTIRSDIFSFGCMVWELLTGRSPLAVMQSSAHFRLPSLAGLISERSEMIDAVLARATSADAETRFESMADLIIAWRDAVGRPEGVLTPIGSQSGLSPDSSRRRAVRALSTAMSSAVNPYKGLRAFGEADASDFFGRDDVIAALHDTLMARSFVAVVGPSGSGKSSLVHAGLVPMLRRDGVLVATMVPGDRPTIALAQALRQITVADIGTTDPSAMFKEAVADGTGRLVLIVDQFEECWTLADVSERERFLSAVVVAGSFGVRCVTTVRADLYDRPLQHALIGQLVADGTFALPPLSAQALEEVVARPAERHGVTFDDGVVSAIVAEANAHPAGLPLLQFAMAELYERRVDNCVTSASLNELGGLGGAIGRRAEDIYTALDDDMQTQARQLFGRLVTPGAGVPDTRRRARHSELSEPARAVADRFVQARLLVADRDLATREPVIEVAHEALLSNWPRLREWLEADRRWLAQLQHLANAARNWDDAGHADSELYRGSRLEAVIEALPERSRELNFDEHGFIEASRMARDASRERERRNTRRLRRRLVATACLLAVSIVAGVVAYTQRQHARTAASSAEVKSLANRSLSLRSSQRDLAALLAVEAWKRAPDTTSKSALFGTFTFDPGFLGYIRFPGSTGSAAIAIPGTTKLLVTHNATSGNFGSDPSQVVDAVTGEVSAQFESLIVDAVEIGVYAVVGSNGRFAAEMQRELGRPYVAGVFDLSTGRKVGPTVQLPGTTSWSQLTVNADGSRLAVGTDLNGGVTVYDTATGRPVSHMVGVNGNAVTDLGYSGSLVYGPDGRLYVGSTSDHLRVFDPSTFDMVDDINVPETSTDGIMKFSPDGKTIVTRGRSKDPANNTQYLAIARIDLTNHTVVWKKSGPDDGEGECGFFAFSVKMNRLWCSNNWGLIHERLMTTAEPTGRTLESQRGGSETLDVMDVPGGTILVAANGYAGLIGRWRIDGGGPIQRLVARDHVLITDLPDGKTLLVGKPNGGAAPFNLDYTLWDTTTDSEQGQLPPFKFASSVGSIVFGAYDDHSIGQYDVTTKHQTSAQYSLVPLPRTANTSLDGTRVLLGYDDGHIDILDSSNARRLSTLQVPKSSGVDRGVAHIAMSDDDSRVYSAGAGLFSFDAVSGRELAHIDDLSIDFVTISRQGIVVATSTNGTLTEYDPNSLAKTASLDGARGGISQVLFSDDGNELLAASDAGTVSIYDVRTGTRLGDPIPTGVFGNTSSVDLRSDGAQAALPGPDGTGAALWDLDPDHWVTAACALAGRNMTRDEWATYIGNLGSYRATCPVYPLST